VNDRAKVARSVSRARATPLQSVYDRLPVGFALFGADLRLAAWNARFAALCEYSRRLVRSGSPLESFLRVDAERGEYGPGPVDALVPRHLASLKRRRRTEREPIRPDGRTVRIASERLADGGILLTCEDVTEARRAAEHLRLSEERYDFAMRAINEGLYDWDIVNDTVHYSDRVYQAATPPARTSRARPTASSATTAIAGATAPGTGRASTGSPCATRAAAPCAWSAQPATSRS
jgi:PAS domain-containing protein